MALQNGFRLPVDEDTSGFIDYCRDKLDDRVEEVERRRGRRVP
jgi:hypothetical protein